MGTRNGLDYTCFPLSLRAVLLFLVFGFRLVVKQLLCAPPAVEPGNLLVEAGLLKCSHACRDIVTTVLRPSLVVAISGGINSCCELLHKTFHLGIDLAIELLPMVPDAFLEMRKFGYFADPS